MYHNAGYHDAGRKAPRPPPPSDRTPRDTVKVQDILRAARASLSGGWSPVGTVTIAVAVALGLMALGVLHVFLKSRGIVLTAAVERSILVRMGPARSVRARGIAVRPGDVDGLRGVFSDLGFDASRIGRDRSAVPRVFVTMLPVDLASVRPPAARKKLFIEILLPHVLLVNEMILASRRKLLALRDGIRSGTLGRRDRAWLADIKSRYRVEDDDLDELIHRADAVPVALALAQAAIESGWGTSRFARDGNALFGQWTWARRGGLAPLRRDDGAVHSVRAFQQIADSVSAYVRNLNTHPAYAAFREARAGLRRAGEALDGFALSSKLGGYSQRGQAYVEDVRGIIRQNRLGRFRDAKLMTRTCRAARDDTALRRTPLIRVPRC